jgi:hypothetical protein
MTNWDANPDPPAQLTPELLRKTWENMAKQKDRPDAPLVVNYDRYKRTLGHTIKNRNCRLCGKDLIEILYMANGEKCRA